jgi:hypothetical protein
VRRELNVSIYRKFFFLHLSSSVRGKRSTIRPSLFKAKGMKAEKSAGLLNFSQFFQGGFKVFSVFSN